MPPALPGSAPDAPLHTHSNKFPIEREVILSASDKNSKIPVLNELKKRGGKLGVAIAPDAPPKQLAAWTRDSMANQQNPTAGTSNEANFRQQYHDQAYAPYGTQNAGGAIPRNIQGHDNAHNSPKTLIPGKNPALYALRPDMKNDGSVHNNSQSITVTVETGKDNTKDAPKSSSKSVTKTYHTLKDMISSRFKGKDSHDGDKAHENETDLNNVADELRKSTRERTEPDSRSMTPRENNNRKTGEQNIYGRPMPQQRSLAEMQYNQQLMQHMHHTSLQGNNSMQAHMQSHAPYSQQQGQPHQQLLTVQQQLLQQQLNQQMMINQHSMMQARSQEMLARPQSQLVADSPQRPQSQLVNQMVTADSIYYHPQYGNMARNTNRGVFQRDGEIPNFTSLKQTAGAQMEGARMKPELRSPQQLEREILRQRSLAESRRAASQPQLPLDEPPRDEQSNDLATHSHCNKMAAARRGSHGNLLEAMGGEGAPVARNLSAELEKDSDEGGFRPRRARNFDGSCRAGKSDGRTCKGDAGAESGKSTEVGENESQRSVEGSYANRAEGGYGAPPQAASRQTPNRLEELKNNSYHNKKMPGSAASSDYDKNGGQSSNVDSGRGSVAYSSGRRPEGTSMHDTSADSDALGLPTVGIEPQNPAGNKAVVSSPGESEWVDIVESELRQILEPKLHNLSINNGVHSTMSESVSSVTPPLPPLSPSGSTPNITPRTSTRYKHQSLPAGSRAEYGEETQQRQRSPGPGVAGSRAPWPHHAHKHRSSSKRDHHASSSQYKKHVFGLDTTDITSTTTRSLDLSSMLDGQSESDASTADARAIRRQLHGLETMYSEVLKLLGVRKPSNHSLGKYQPSDPRLAKRRYGSMSSLPSSSVSSRPVRDKRRSMTEHRKKVNDMKSINKRFQRLESHVVTLARSVAHLSSEMRTQHLMMQEMENIRSDISALRSMHRSQSLHRMTNGFACAASGGVTEFDPLSFTNPHRVKKLTKFFGDEPPLMRLFLKRLGYEKYAPLLEAERVGAAELPYVGEDRLRALGVPLGPRLRILREAGAQAELPPMPTRDAAGNTTTTLCIV